MHVCNAHTAVCQLLLKRLPGSRFLYCVMIGMLPWHAVMQLSEQCIAFHSLKIMEVSGQINMKHTPGDSRTQTPQGMQYPSVHPGCFWASMGVSLISLKCSLWLYRAQAAHLKSSQLIMQTDAEVLRVPQV